MTDNDNQMDSCGEAPETVMAGEPPVDEQVAAVARERDEWRDKAYRLAADMENAKRRTQQELEGTRKFALQGFAKDLLPIADNLVRALQAPEGNEKALRDGVTMVAAQLEQIFGRHGVTRVAAQPGQALDPNLHQAMAEVDAPEGFTGSAGTIVAEMQSGFTLNERLLRPAMVSVARGK